MMSIRNGTRASRPPWRPHWRGLTAVTLVGAAALGLALYMRYGLVEPSSVGLVCDAGGLTGVCVVRRVFIGIFVNEGFGIAALIATVLALLRPGIVMVAVALAAGLLGVVLYNTGLSALALSLLPLVLARSAPAPEFRPE
jgi:hypothetical protein